MNVAIIDIETTPIPDLVNNVKKIYCICIKVNDDPVRVFTEHYFKNSNGNFKTALNLLNNCDLVVGHNIIKFDIPIIEKFVGKITTKIADTLIDTKLMYSKDELLMNDESISIPPSLKGSYSLKAFGYRFNSLKIEYEDFSSGLNTKMIEYCTQDVELTYKIYNFISKLPFYPSLEVRECEYQVARVIYEQEQFGFYFDIEKAMQLAVKLKMRKMNIEHKLLKVFPPTLVADGDIVNPKTSRTKKIYFNEEIDTFKNLRPFKIGLVIDKKGRYKTYKAKFRDKPFRFINANIDGAYQKLKLQKFNPGSRTQVVEKLMKEYNWQPTNYTEKGAIRLEFE